MFHLRLLATCLVPALLSLTPETALATVFTYHLDGEVTRIVDNTAGPMASQLAAHGVQKGSSVAIDWTVDSSIGTQGPEGNFTISYFGHVTAFTIQIGSWTATGSDTGVPTNRLQIRDEVPPRGLDAYDMFRSGTDTLTGGAGTPMIVGGIDAVELVLHLYDPSGRAGTSTAIGDQTPSLYPGRSGTVSGMNGEIDFSAPVTQPPVDTSQQCRASQLASAGVLCRATALCLATHAKAPDKDPGELKLGACRKKAEDKFAIAFDAASAKATSKGLTCATTDTGAMAVAHFDVLVSDLLSLEDLIHPSQPALVSGWYAAGGALCAAELKAESKNATKPDPNKLAQLRATARSRATTVAQKALVKAEKSGVVFSPEPDVALLVSSIDTLIDDIVNEIDGP
jgi:hypothetical protein